MKLTQIELRTKFKHPKEKKFNKESWPIPELYWSSLKSYNTFKTRKCVVRLDNDWGTDLNKITNQANVIQININFDFKTYFKQSSLDKKKMQLEVLHYGMMKIADMENWEINGLLDAYNNCIERDLKYGFFISKKPKVSPDRKFFINFWCEWDIKICKLYYILYNKNKEEQRRKLLIKKESFFGEFVYYIKYKWDGNTKVILENNHNTKEVFNINVIKHLEEET